MTRRRAPGRDGTRGRPALRRRGAERELRDALRAARTPDENGAADRVLARVLAAHAATAAAPRGRLRPALVIAVVVAAIVASGLTSPGQAVGEWIREVVHPSSKPTRAPAAALPPGRVLTTERLGPYREATWSPRGRFTAATTATELRATTGSGVVRWRVRPPAPPRHPAWSPDGFRIAYLAGPQLRVVIGDGTDDRLFWGHARDVAPVFRPTASRSVAWVEGDGHVRLADVDRAQLEWRSPAQVPRRTRTLSWSSDGSRLLAAGQNRARLFDLADGSTRTIRGRFAAGVFPPVAGRAALLERRGGRSSIRLLGAREPLIATAGRYRGLAWSPDGRWLLTRWGNQWLYISRDGRRVLTAPSSGTPLGWSR